MAKREQVSIRLSKQDKELIRYAAKLTGVSMNEFILRAVEQRIRLHEGMGN